jgi:hypothetical protein
MRSKVSKFDLLGKVLAGKLVEAPRIGPQMKSKPVQRAGQNIIMNKSGKKQLRVCVSALRWNFQAFECHPRSSSRFIRQAKLGIDFQ